MTFRKSSYSNSTGGECIEIGDAPSGVLIRDTKQAHRDNRTILTVTAEAWSQFISTINK